jgi:hypothetical protein
MNVSVPEVGSIYCDHHLLTRSKVLTSPTVRSSHTSLATPSIIEEDPGTDDDDWWYKGMDTLLLTRSGERRYVGKAAAMYLAQKLSPTPETSLAWDSNPMYKSSLKRPASLTLPQLPPYDFARRLFAAQHIYIGTIFSFLQPHVWATRWRNSSENTDGNPGSFITAAAQ